jgi:hypothetical protein
MALKELIFRVITSWQVIVVTVGLVLYFFLFFYAARPRQGKRPPAYSPAGSKPAAEAPPLPAAEAPDEDELGLEEDAADK